MDSMKNNTEDINQSPLSLPVKLGEKLIYPVLPCFILECGGLIDSDPRSEMPFTFHHSCQDCVRDRQIIFIVLCSLERFDSICNRQFINIFLCGPGGGQERERGRVRGYWIQASLLMKQFQQVETCFWICNSPNPSSPSPSAFCRPPLALLLFILSLCLISISAGLISLCSGQKSFALASPCNSDLHVFIIQTLSAVTGKMGGNKEKLERAGGWGEA